MPLKSRTKMPPGGWQFFQTETNWKNPYPMSDTFERAVDRIIAHRKNNPRFNFALDRATVAELLETFTCVRLGHDPAWCDGQKKTSQDTEFQPAQPGPSKPVQPARHLRNLVAGSKILTEWLGEGGRPVSRAEAQSRANVCLKCPLNVKPDLLHKITGALAGFIQAKSDLKLTLDVEERLHTCDACDCHLPLKVWTPLDVILGHTDDATMGRLHKDCWVTKKHDKHPICILQLGRAGDVVNILPIAKELSDRRGFPIPIVIHADYADILDGVSYATPEIYHGEISDFHGALAFAGERFTEVVDTQVYGRKTFESKHDSFSVDSWEAGKFGALWGKLPLIFDKRDKAREKALIEQHVKTNKPLLLVNFKGHSSPYQFSGPMMTDITQRWGSLFEIVNLAGVQAHRFYDLIGLMERANGIVSIDTGTAHMAGATNTPLILLQASTPSMWHGMKPPQNCELVLRYPESLRRREEMHCVIDSWKTNKKPFRFWHVYSEFTAAGDNRRASVAAATWRAAYDENWRAIPIRDEQLPRMFEDKGRKLPYIKDLLDFACLFAEDGDYIVLTNSDICFTRRITGQLVERMKSVDLGYCIRRDFSMPFGAPLNDDEVLKGNEYSGKDLFVFKKSWWLANRSKFPDMLLGAEGWDACMAILIEEGFGSNWNDLIYHEEHNSFWVQPGNRYAIPSQKHNLKLAKAFMVERQINPGIHGIV